MAKEDRLKLTEIVWGRIDESYGDAIEVFRNRDQVWSKSRLEGSIDFFKDLKKRNLIRGREADIGYWVSQGWPAFQAFLEEAKHKVSKRGSKKARWRKASGQIFLHRDDDEVKILTPLTQDASFYHGTAAWCTGTYESFDFLNNLLFGHILFYVLEKNGRKWAARYRPPMKSMKVFKDYNEWDFFDENNKHVTPEQFPYDVEQYLTEELIAEVNKRRQNLVDEIKNNGDFDFRHISLEFLDLRGTKQTNKEIPLLMITKTNLSNSDFSGTTLGRLQGSGAKFDKSKFIGSDLSNSSIHKTSFEGVDFSNALLGTFYDCNLNKAIFTNASFGGEWKKVIMSCSVEGAIFKGADLSNVSFERTSINDADFRGVVYDGEFPKFSNCSGTPAFWPEGYDPSLQKTRRF